MINFIMIVLIFHGLLYWLWFAYKDSVKINYKRPTKFEMMLFWPMMIGILPRFEEKKHD